MPQKWTFLGGGNGDAASAKGKLEQGNDPVFAIICGDGDDLSSKSLRWWQQYIAYQTAQSRIMRPAWANTRFGCSSWRIRPNWRLTGPFSTPKADAAGLPDAPAAPILFMSNRLDPVTPFAAAQRMARQHPGSGLLIQNTMGHTVLGTSPSSCVAKALRDYFESGTLPGPPSRVAFCEPQCQPWDDNCEADPKADDTSKRSVWSESEEDLSPLQVNNFPLDLFHKELQPTWSDWSGIPTAGVQGSRIE